MSLLGALRFRLERMVGRACGRALPPAVLQACVARAFDRDPNIVLQGCSPQLNRGLTLDTMPFDLDTNVVEFQHLAGLFASNSLNHGVIAMTIRQAAYLFGLIRQMKAQKVIEVGRYKGGSTLVIAAAMQGTGRLWSIDIGEKEQRLYGRAVRTFDDQISDMCKRFGLSADLIVGDSRTLAIDTGEVDVVLIDGDHTYEGVRNDFERFGRRLRVGGALLFDDACAEQFFPTHVDTVGRLVHEIVAAQEFRLVKTVDRLAHLERVRAARS